MRNAELEMKRRAREEEPTPELDFPWVDNAEFPSFLNAPYDNLAQFDLDGLELHGTVSAPFFYGVTTPPISPTFIAYMPQVMAFVQSTSSCATAQYFRSFKCCLLSWAMLE